MRSNELIRPAPRMEALAAHVRVMRPYSLVWFVAAPVATMALWLNGASLSVPQLVALISSLALTDAGLTTLNEVCDRETDLLSVEPQRHTRPLACGRMSKRAAYAQVVVLEVAALVASFVVSPPLTMLLALGIVYGVAYSVRPVSLGGRAVVSQAFWLVLWPGIYLGVYIAMHGDFLRGVPYVVSTAVFMGVGETLAKDIRDVDNDGATGRATTPVAWGVPVTASAAAAAFALGAVGYLVSVVVLVDGAALAVAMAVVLGLWCIDAGKLAAELRQAYDKGTARALHMGAIRVFLTVNLLLIAGLACR